MLTLWIEIVKLEELFGFMEITDLNEQELGRRASLQKLHELGIEPYPAAEFPVNEVVDYEYTDEPVLDYRQYMDKLGELIDNYDEEFLINDENNDSDVTEGLVGTNTWTVSKNVTAKLVKEGKKNVLYLESKGGQLSEPTPSNIWDFWFTVIDTDVVSNVNVIKLTDNSTKLYLPKTNFGTFWGRNFHNLEEVYFNKMDISKSTALSV